MRKWSVSHTGARRGTILVGHCKRTAETRIVLDQDVYPCASYVPVDEEFDDLLDHMQTLPGFKDSSREDISKWLKEKQCESSAESIGIEEGQPDALIQFYEVGTKFQNELSEEDFVMLSTKQHTARQIESMFPTAMHEKKTTLVLNRSGWNIERVANIDRQTDGCVFWIDLESGQEVKQAPQNKQFLRVTSQGVKFGIFYQTQPKPPPITTPPILTPLNDFFSKLSLGALKSLLQKLIRFQGRRVVVPFVSGDQFFETSDVLRYVMLLMVHHTGSFVPQLQQFEYGLPSLLKRLVVIAFEDAFVMNSDTTLQSLALGALVATYDKRYWPTTEQLNKWLDFGQAMLHSPDAVKYDVARAGNPFSIRPGMTPLQRVSVVLDILKSFAWDLTMIRYVARYGVVSVNRQYDSLEHDMPLGHFCDYHISPQIVYLMDPKSVALAQAAYRADETFGDLQATPFAPMFRALFHQLTGLNPRREDISLAHNGAFATMARCAQKLFLHMSTPSLAATPASSATGASPSAHKIIEYKLDPMWAAAGLGHIQVKIGAKAYYVIVSSVVPEVKFEVVRVPSRSQRETIIDEKERLAAIKKAQAMLPELKARYTTVFNKPVPWTELKQGNFQLQLVDSVISDVDVMLRMFEQLDRYQQNRFFQHTSGFRTMITLPRISRSGSTDASAEHGLACVSIHDVAVAAFLRKLCAHAPDMITPRPNAMQFQVLKPAVWFTLLQKWRVTSDAPTNTNLWDTFRRSDKDKRILTESQAIALGNMKSQHLAGRHGSVLVMPTGTGKTLVMLLFLAWLARRNELSMNVLYAVPSTAHDAIVKEIKMFTSQVCIWSGYKKERQIQLRPGWIYVVDLQHHVRLLNHQLEAMNIAQDWTLIVDELHLCLRDSQRSNVTHRLFAQARKSIACSATPAIDSNVYRFLPFLREAVPFEIDPKNNFFVAYSFVQEQLIQTPIKVDVETLILKVPKSNTGYWSRLTTGFGGENPQRMTEADIKLLLKEELENATQNAVALAVQLASQGEKLFLVAKNNAHAENIAGVLQQNGLTCLSMLTAETQRNVTEPIREDVVLVTMSRCEGYSVTVCKHMVLFVVNSNLATRTQIRGRINRLSTPYESITITTIVGGELQNAIEKRYQQDDSFGAILKDFANGRIQDKKRKTSLMADTHKRGRVD